MVSAARTRLLRSRLISDDAGNLYVTTQYGGKFQFRLLVLLRARMRECVRVDAQLWKVYREGPLNKLVTEPRISATATVTVATTTPGTNLACGRARVKAQIRVSDTNS